uniref:RNA-dependent RNA polymerase n=1 Tax=Foveavirus mali TaxID=35350 RepID=A8CLZ0_9VIRU|nr:RNA-dependent RNA polymerase [Apple stem pitting virus]
MALLSRTAAEEVIASFTSEEQSRISTQAVLTLTNVEKDKHDLFNYALPEFAKIKLFNSGIYLSPHSYRPHSHPACKTQENNILFNILPSYLDNSFYLVSIKKNKVDFQKRRHPDLQMVETINRYISSLDKLRYGSFFHVRPSKVSPKFRCDRRTGFEADASLVDLIPGCMEGARKKFFFHDELHYWKKEALKTFLDHVKPEIMPASIVYPPEILAGAKESPNPWCYTFKILDKDLVFFPDGEESEAYIQPLSGSYLLKAGKIITPSGDVFQLDFLKSSFSHHLISITKGEAIGQKMRFFNGFQAVAMKGLHPLRRRVESCLPISKNTILKIYRYLITLKKPHLQSAMAKLTQVCKDPNGYEIMFFEEFSKLCLRCQTLNTNMLPYMKSIVQGFFLKLFPNPISRNFKVVQQLHLQNFIQTLEEFNFSINTEDLSLNWKEDLEFVNLTFGDMDFHVEETFAETWGTKRDIVHIITVHHSPYLVSKFQSYHHQFHSLLCSNSTTALTQIAKIVLSLYHPCVAQAFSQSRVSNLAVNVIIAANLRACFAVTDLWKVFQGILLQEGKKAQGKMRKRFHFELGIRWFLFVDISNQWFLPPCRDGLIARSVSIIQIVKHCQFHNSLDNARMSLRQVLKGPKFQALFHVSRLSVLHNSSMENAIKAGTSLAPSMHPTSRSLQDASASNASSHVTSCIWGLLCLAHPAKVNTPQLNLAFHVFIKGFNHRGVSLYSRDLSQYSSSGYLQVSKEWPKLLGKIFSENIIPLKFYKQCGNEEYRSGDGGSIQNYDNFIFANSRNAFTVNYSGDAIFCIECLGSGFVIRMSGPQMLLIPLGFRKNHRLRIKSPSNGRTASTFRLTHASDNEVPNQEVVTICDHVDSDDSDALKAFEIRSRQCGGRPAEQLEGHQREKVNHVSSDSAPVQEFLVQIIFSLYEYGLKSLSGPPMDDIICHMCSCYSPSFKNEEFRFSQILRDLAFAQGLIQLIDFLCLKVLRCAEVNRIICELPSHVLPLRGTRSIVDLDDGSISKDVNVSFFSGSRRWKVTKSFSDLIILALLHPKMTLGGELRSHEYEWGVSNFTEQLHRFSIILSRKFEPHFSNSFALDGKRISSWPSMGPLIGVDGEHLKRNLHHQAQKTRGKGPTLSTQFGGNSSAEREAVAFFSSHYWLRLNVLYTREGFTRILKPHEVFRIATLDCQDNNFQPSMPRNGCVHRAASSGPGRRAADLLAVLGNPAHEKIFEEVADGRGFSIFDLTRLFEIFSICGSVDTGREFIKFNENGRISAELSFEKEHLARVPTLSRRKFNPIMSDLTRVLNRAMRSVVINGAQADHRRSNERASTLIDCFQIHATDHFWPLIQEARKDLASKLIPELVHERKLIMISGMLGCGKSSLFKKFIEKSPGKAIAFTAPRRSLAESINHDLGLARVGGKKTGKSKDLKNVRVKTFELFILHLANLKEGHTVVIDEIQLFPPGYIDLIILGLRPDVNIIIAGDPCQSDYDSRSDRHIFAGRQSDIMRILSGRSYKFNILSQRFRNPVSYGRFPCYLNQTRLTLDLEELLFGDSIQEFSMMGRQDCPVELVSIFEEKQIVAAHLGLQIKCITYGDSTGFDLQKGAILVTYQRALTRNLRWWTAFSRLRKEIHFDHGMGGTWDNASLNRVGQPLHKQYTKSACHDHGGVPHPRWRELSQGFQSQLGADEGSMGAKAEGETWLKTKAAHGQNPHIQIQIVSQVQAAEARFTTHIPTIRLEALRARWVHKLISRADREFHIGNSTTDDYADDHSCNRGLDSTHPDQRSCAIYPRHNAMDPATFLMAVKKRLSFSSAAVEHAGDRRAKPRCKSLPGAFLKRVPRSRSHHQKIMQEAVHAFEERELSKSIASIGDHSGRSCQDWPVDKALIFMKSQLCTKFDKRSTRAKAGQTLACFQHSARCRFAPYIRYIESKVTEVLPKNLYIHSGKNIDDLAAWVATSKFNGVCTESDDEAFDASQDHFIMVLELEVMKFLGLPSDLIADRTFIKTHLGSKLGSFAIMRFTHDSNTFLFNTMANMLVAYLSGDLNGREAIRFRGGSMCANSRLKVTNRRSNYLDNPKLKAKWQFITIPTFYESGLIEISTFKIPDRVLERGQIASHVRRLEICIPNYAREVSCAYKMGDHLNLYLTPKTVDAHYNCVRFIVQHNHLLKSNIRDLFRGEVVPASS